MFEMSTLRFLKPKEIFINATNKLDIEVRATMNYPSSRVTIKNYQKKHDPSHCSIYVKTFEDLKVSLSTANSFIFKYGNKYQFELCYEIENYSTKATVKRRKLNFSAHNLYIYDKEFLKSVVTKKHILFVDSTYYASTLLGDRKTQLLTIFIEFLNDKNVEENSSQAFPCFWALMNAKTKDAYLKVFQFIKGNIPNFNPEVGMSDFETALSEALTETFPGLIKRNCQFHYSQAIHRQAEKKIPGFKSQILRDGKSDIQIVLSQLSALAYLPAHLIEPTFYNIMEIAKVDFGDIFGSFSDYYKKQWLKVVTPEFFSVYKINKNRTDNILESYHKTLNAAMGKNPSFGKLWDYIKLLMFESRTTAYAVENYLLKKREEKKSTIVRKDDCKRLWEDLDKNMDNMSALDCINKNITKVANKIMEERLLIDKFLNGITTKDIDISKCPDLRPCIIFGSSDINQLREALIFIKHKYLQKHEMMPFDLINQNEIDDSQIDSLKNSYSDIIIC